MRRMMMMSLALAVSAACFGGGVTGSSTVTGEYVLRTVNGAPLPYTLPGSGTVKTELLDNVITLYMGQTFSEVSHSRTTANGQVTNQTNNETGSWVPFGNAVKMRGNNGGPEVVANFNANTMTIVKDGMTSVFTK